MLIGDSMKVLNFINKNWKICLILVIILSGIIVGLYFVKGNTENEEDKPSPTQTEDVLLFTVADVSKNCFSNGLKVYNNNKYEIIKGTVPVGEDNLIKTGTYNYDINKLMTSFNNDTCDMDNYFNYQVTLESGESYCISIIEDTELNKFLESLNEENLFWCS